MTTGVPILGQQSIPMGLSLVGVLMSDGRVGPLPLGDVYILVVLHALVSRESANLASTSDLARLAVAIAGQAVRARDQSTAPSSPVPAPPAPG